MAFLKPLHDAGITRLLMFTFFFFLLSNYADAKTSSVTTLQTRRGYPPPRQLSSRDDSESCAVPCQAPSKFCCRSGTVCQLVASGTTAICCPKGSSCNNVSPVNCDIRSQDPSLFPNAPILTTALDKDLPTCGDACCPFGYICGEAKICVRDIYGDDNSPPSPSSSASPTTGTAIPLKSQPAEDASQTSAAPTESSSSASATKNQDVNLIGLVTAIVVAGVCFLAGILILVWFRWGRGNIETSHNDNDNRQSTGGWFSWGQKSTSPESLTHHKVQSWSSSELSKLGSPQQPSELAQNVVWQPPPVEKYIITPNDTPMTPNWPLPKEGLPPRHFTASPLELPASPVSLCMWQNLEHAVLEEPKIAYVIPAKQIQKRAELAGDKAEV